MIDLRTLSKSFWIKGTRKPVLDQLSLTLPEGRSLALLGQNGAGKSTLLNIIAGTMAPDAGQVIRKGSISWPVGLGGAFHPQLSGAQNVRFVARVYGVDSDQLLAFVQEFSELGAQFHNPVRSYSAGMKARLGFGLSMGIRFDTYLIDEITAVGDARFHRKSRAVFLDRVQRASAIVVSHQMNTIRDFCDMGAVLHQGQLELYDDLETAIARHQSLNG